MNIYYRAPLIYCKLFILIFDVIFSIAKGVQHDGGLPFWKPASVFAHYVRIVIVFAIDKINILLRSCILLLNIERVSYISFCKIHISYTYLIRRTRDESNLGRY